jgi:Ran GTPase-activating protein (RanGAP) involved in mRNA processing and transport
MSDRLKFLAFCAKVRNSDPSILPEPGQPLRIRNLSENDATELADALLENTNVTNLELGTGNYTTSSAEAMAKYVRTSKRLQRIHFSRYLMSDPRVLQQHAEAFCCFLHAIQESTSLKELSTELPLVGGPSSLAFENMLAHTQSLQSLTLCSRGFPIEDMALAAVWSGLKQNTTLRELTLDIPYDATDITPILSNLCDHPHLRRLYLLGKVVVLTGLDTLLLSDNSKITELDIHAPGSYGGPPILGLSPVLQALARRPTLTMLTLRCFYLSRDEARLLQMALRNTLSLQTLVLEGGTLGSAELAELAPALYRNTSIKVLDMSNNDLNNIESAEILRDIIRRNKTMTILDLSGHGFGNTTGAVERVADGLGSNSSLLEINLSCCALGDGSISTLAQNIGSRNVTLQKLTLDDNSVTPTGVGVLLETMEQNSHPITDLDLKHNPIGDEGASLLARSLGNNALPTLTRLSLYGCGICNDGFITLMSALEQNTSLLHLDLRHNNFGTSERAFSVLAESLPEIKVLQRVHFEWCSGLASAMPLLLEGLRKNTSLFRFHVTHCAPHRVPPTPAETAICAGGWMQEIERLGYRNRFLPLIRAPKEGLPHLGVWPHALARVAILPDLIFEVLRSKPSLVPSEDTAGDKEAATDTGVPNKRKRGDE